MERLSIYLMVIVQLFQIYLLLLISESGSLTSVFFSVIVSPWKYLHIAGTCATNGNKAALEADLIGSRLETQTPTQIPGGKNNNEITRRGGQSGIDT